MLGEWNAFAAEPMTAGAGGVYGWTGSLMPRAYAYRFEVGSTELLDEANPFRRYVGETESSRLDVPDCAAPLIQLTRFSATADGTLTVEAQALRGSSQSELKAPVATLDGAATPVTWDKSSGRLTLSVKGLAPTKHTATLALADGAGRAADGLYLPFWIEAQPFDWRDAVIYFPMVDRFRDGDLNNDNPVSGVAAQANYRGGDLNGIRASIDDGYFDQLGVRALWISPLDTNPDSAWPGSQSQLYTGYHGYWPSRPHELSARFGTPDDLTGLVSAAHQHGIRVLADVVLNHVHQDHPYYAAHKADGWFHQTGACICGDPGCDWDVHRIDCWFAPYLPDYDLRNPQLDDQLMADLITWVKAADLDGVRLDAVKHFEHLGGRHVAGTLHAITALTGLRYYLVGETFTGGDLAGRTLISDYIGPNELDGQFDFPLYWALIDAFASGGPLDALDATLATDDAAYPPGALMSPFLGNQDVPRFTSIAAGQIAADSSAQAWSNPPPADVTDPAAFQKAKWAFAFLFTQPGVPLLYYGDEVGLPGAGDPDNRRLMRFDSQLTAEEADLLAWVRKLGQARRASEALRRGDRHTLRVDADTYVYQRESDGDEAVVAINRGAARTVQVSPVGRLGQESLSFTDAIGGGTLMIGGATSLVLPAGGVQLWVRQ